MPEDSSFEEILAGVGSNGRYQKLLFWVFYIPMGFLIPWTVLVQVFQSSVPDHWCHVPGKPQNMSVEEWKNLTVPWEKREGLWEVKNCHQYPDGKSNSSVKNFVKYLNDSHYIECQNGWNYDKTWYDSTLASEVNWVCSQDSYVARWLSVGAAGNIVGTLIFNSLSDIYGRKPVWLVTTVGYAILGLVRLFVLSEWWILIIMFFSSAAFPANLEVTMILVLEQMSGAWRGHVAASGFMTWTFGMSLLPMIAWLCRDWITLGIVTSIPFLPMALCSKFVMESPRWLASRGRISDAMEVLKRMAKMNGKELPPDVEIKLQKYVEPSKKFELSDTAFIQLFAYPTLRKRTILITICYLCNNAIYYGLIYNIGNMSGNEFFNFFLLSVTELPTNLLGWASSQIIGRRFTAVLFFFLSVVTVTIPIFLPSSLSTVTNMLLISCKGLINVSFLVVYIQFGEIYPTSHRASGAGFSSVVSSIVGTTAPFIAYSSKHWSKLPYVILGCLGLVGMVASLPLPETLNKPMPQTLWEGENHLVNQPFWSYLGKRPNFRRKRKPEDGNELRENTHILNSS